jgi:hypothetical protein
MKRPLFSTALICALSACSLFLSGCSTTESRISDHPEIFNSLRPRDQELVRNGQIRVGMAENAVWLSWGAPQQKAVGQMRGGQTETWIYLDTTSYPYPYHGGGYYGGGFYGGYGFVGVVHRHHGRGFAFFGDPFYDPFYYSAIPPTISYPYKVVTFRDGRVVSFQMLTPP